MNTTTVDITEVFQPCAEEIVKAFPDLTLISNVYMQDKACGYDERKFEFYSLEVAVETDGVLGLIKLFAEVNDLEVSISVDSRSKPRIFHGSNDIGWILITNYTGTGMGALIISIIQYL